MRTLDLGKVVPEKGIDYFTEAEINEIVEDVTETVIVPEKTSDLTNDSGFIDNTVNNLANYELKTNTGSVIELSINSDYVMTLNLKNSAGTTISTQNIDLPLETMVVGASYSNVTKNITLTLQNGTTTSFSVADLVSGLQTEITSSNKLSSDLVDDTTSTNKFVTSAEKTAWNNKQNALTAGTNITIENNVISASGGSNLPIYYLFHNNPLSYKPNNMGSDIENIINDAYTKGYSTFTLLLICRQSSGGDFISQIYSNPAGFANYDLQSKPSRLTFQTFSTNDLSAYSYNTITINLSWNEDVAHFVSLQGTSISRKYLTTANTTAYTPTSDYNPATKKYVDDSIAAAITTTLGGSF